MPIKYKYEGKDKNGNKKFSKSYKTSKWVGDYENNCVRDYDNYIKESLKNGSLMEEDIQYISYFEGSYENACKFFNISGENCRVYDKSMGKNVIVTDEEDSRNIKIQRLMKVVEKHQTNPRYIKKSSAEMKPILISSMNEQYYYVAPEHREDTAMEVIELVYDTYLKPIDKVLISAGQAKEITKEYEEMLKNSLGELYTEEDEAIAKSNIEKATLPRSIQKRINKLEYFISKNINIKRKLEG